MGELTPTAAEIRDRAIGVIYQEHCSTVDAVDKVLADIEVPLEAAEELVRVGLRHLVDKELSADRRRGAESSCESELGDGSVRSGRFQLRPATSETSARYYWLNKVYCTHDGRQMPILEFDGDDLAQAVERMGRLAAEYASMKDFFGVCRDRLGSHPRAERLADLPRKVLDELEAAAGSVLGGAA